ncbi:MAG: SapC family protein [Sulfurimonas sp.]|uniref:SapC family protein n=1 Tax=Sulfurimonas sp. TaxID=2022749 RepID=UPI0026253F15|nr:SapC family protein [Sulfurimonas sp.]MDD5371931.1 SapC family protein [Sulfurimonas sp.]
MARKVRIFVKDSSQHVILKSLDKLTVFRDESDYRAFAAILKESSANNDLAVHAYVLMPNYFEFLATPLNEDALSKFMQSLGRKYVGYFNKKYNRTGTIWEGRYKSSLVENDKFLFDVMIYIEKLAPKEHPFSSIYKNLYNKKDDLVSYHSLYKKLGFTDEQRVQKYSTLFDSKTDKSEFIATSLEKQSITGSLEFIKNLEIIVGMSLSLKERGRPKKDHIEKGKKMYKNLAILDKEKHKELKINPLTDLNFAKSATHIPVLASEVSQVGELFPIVFTADENPSLTAVVSLGTDSLAITADGKWITSYVPSYLRKYPFSLASTKENPQQKVILIDEDSSLFSKSKGKQLFKKDGEKSEVLEHAINFLTSYDTQMSVTQNVAKIISQSGILEDREISVGEGDEKKVLVNGFKVVDREKLNALSDDILADWVRKGIMTMIDAHLKSLNNIGTLFEIAQKRQS